MYQQFYNLDRAPFQATIDPDFYWEGEHYAKFVTALRSDLEQHGRLTLVTGRPGCGKTTLISTALAALDPSVLVAMISDSRLTIQEFYDLTAHAFHLPGQITSRAMFHEAIRDLLHKASEQQKHILLVVDEAQQLSAELIEEIEEIIDLRSNGRDRLSVCLVGQLGDGDGFKGRIIHAFENRDMVLHYLAPLTPEETSSYIYHRLKIAGARHDIFTDDAIFEIHRYSGGYPVQINIICDVALFIGCTIKATAIDADLIRLNAEKLQFPHTSHPSKESTRIVGWGNADRNTNDDSIRPEHDTDAAAVQEQPSVTPLPGSTDVGQNSAPGRFFTLPALGLLLALALGGGGYVYYAQYSAVRPESPAPHIGAVGEAGTDKPAGQSTEGPHVTPQHTPAVPSPLQAGSVPDGAGTPPLIAATPADQQGTGNQAGAVKVQPVQHIGAAREAGTGKPAGQSTEGPHVTPQHTPAIPSPPQGDSTPDEASIPPLNAATPADQLGTAAQAHLAGEALPKVVARNGAKDVFGQDFTAGEPNELVLPQLKDDIQDFLHEVTQELLREKSVPLVPDAEQTTAVDPIPTEAEVDPGTIEAEDELEKDETEKTAQPVAEGRMKLKEFLAAGAFDEYTAPTPQEPNEDAPPDQSAAAPQSKETEKVKIEPSPANAIDWLLQKKARTGQSPAE